MLTRSRNCDRFGFPDLNETHSHQGNFYFSTSGYIELILFYTTIPPLYIRHTGYPNKNYYHDLKFFVKYRKPSGLF